MTKLPMEVRLTISKGKIADTARSMIIIHELTITQIAELLRDVADEMEKK